MVLKFCNRCAVIALSFAAVGVLTVSDASAQRQKKMSYNQAYADCKAQVDRTVPADQQSARQTAGGACMKSHGYRLKKKAKI